MNPQVENGIKLLDLKSPGWREKVDVKRLDMFHCCVLTQVFGDYKDGVGKLGLGYRWHDGTVQFDTHQVANYGFTLANCCWNAEAFHLWAKLTADWKQAIAPA